MSWRINIFSVILLLVLTLTGCNFPIQPSTSPSDTSLENIELPLMAVVTFQAQLPENTPEGEAIYITVLDEVTGLALNVQRHEMQALDERVYAASLPLPVGSIVKYRYSRRGDFLVDEHTSNKLPVRYRLYQVLNPGVVKDVVSAWSDTTFTGSTGRILGQVSDNGSGEPIAGLLITAGGSQSLTSSDGSFFMEGLPAGTHNLVVYALDGRYRTFQQGAVIAPNSTTPASIQVTRAETVRVTFTASLPEGTLAGVPVRLAGNLLSLGNTFSDLAGGTSVLASRMPVLTPLPDGRYSLTIDLPAGAYVEYKYTLGDGFWNAEHNKNGAFNLRNFSVPEGDASLEDRVDNWGATTDAGIVLFDLTTPLETLAGDLVSIQFNPFGWTEPIPMWTLGDNHWSYLLYSPITNGQELTYRYCRNDQCGSADDATTPGAISAGRKIEITAERQSIKDNVDAWKWLAGESLEALPETTNVSLRETSFFQGIELQPAYHPSYLPLMPLALKEIRDLGADWTIFTPAWIYTRQAPPVLEPVTGRAPLWEEFTTFIEQAHALDLNVALFPTPRFSPSADDWWQSAPRDFAWWVVWFERYRSFLLYHADLASSTGVKSIILGGDWIRPALPGGVISDGTPSGVPADAGPRWRSMISEVRDHFDGEVYWATEASPSGIRLPPFIDAVDRLYLLWSLPLADSANAEPATLAANAAHYMESEIFPLELTVGKPVILSIGYPSVEGMLTGCFPASGESRISDCIDFNHLARPNPEISGLSTDLSGQVQAYNAVLAALNERLWIDGIVSRGFNPAVALQDYSLSVRGKPAQDLLKIWFTQMLPSQIP